MIRRLCICTFQCPLCMEDHETGLYISMPVDDLDEYVAQLRHYAEDWHLLQPALTQETIRFHKKQGDLDALCQQAGQHGVLTTRPPTLDLTDESAYTCDDCSRTFESIKNLRDHMAICR